MEIDYGRKLEEMKRYIPFLDNMIRRLKSTSCGSSNPRQAQLSKIQSLRELLQDKKKRMKIENLLKCEQVLVNLYAKVEQRDNDSDINKEKALQPIKTVESPSLETVRNKLKYVTMMNAAQAETLPEIAGPCETARICTLDSKKPVLFQRRSQLPNVISPSKSKDSALISPSKSTVKRGYTRVLVSPEPSNHHKASSNELFCKSSKILPKSPSPSCNKQELQATSKNVNQTAISNDLNITLNVPQDSLSSLNTKDILSRIITCRNDDVDIETLRGLRIQILSELKQTGSKDDISELILKSYKTKKSSVTSKDDVEEGELSDSESEAIESIYGSLVVVDKDKSNILIKNTPENDQACKIQICLVINSKDDQKADLIVKHPQKTIDESDIYMSNKLSTKNNEILEEQRHKKQFHQINLKNDKKQCYEIETLRKTKETQYLNNKGNSDDTCANSNKTPLLTNIQASEEVVNTEIGKKDPVVESDKNTNKLKTNLIDYTSATDNSFQQVSNSLIQPIAFQANFYKPIANEVASNKDNMVISESLNENQEFKKSNISQIRVTQTNNKQEFYNTNKKNKKKNKKRSSFNKPRSTNNNVAKDVVSQIDILQALKNEILNENIDVQEAEVITPPLHQPKLVKVASGQKVIPNRISIEKYKAKAASMSPLFINSNRLFNSSTDDSLKKPSIKLTEKECERFNFTTNMVLEEVHKGTKEDVDKNNQVLNHLYDDLAPKSPDWDDSNDISHANPIIIPAEPVKGFVSSSKADVDMRTFKRNLSNEVNSPNTYVDLSQVTKQKGSDSEIPSDKKKSQSDKSIIQFLDSRISKNMKPVNNDKSFHQTPKGDKISKSSTYSNVSTGTHTSKTTPNTNASMTSNCSPNIPPLVALNPNSRTYESTPTCQLFEVDGDVPSGKHVYAPSFPLLECRNTNDNDYWNFESNTRKKSRWEGNNCNDPHLKDTASYSPVVNRYKIDRRIDNPRMDCPLTPVPSFGWANSSIAPTNYYSRSDCPSTPSHPFGRSEFPLTPSHPFGRLDSSATPHYLGRNDCPTTPIHTFGRLDCPATPSHPFGESEGPETPIYQFGRADCPLTPNHPFGRLDGSATPSHPFGRFEGSATPSHPFGRLEGHTTPNHSFGRFERSGTPSHSFNINDHAHNTINRQMQYLDPRKNKNSYYDQDGHSVEKEVRYYKDRSFNHENMLNSHKPYLNRYGNFDRELSIGRSDYNSYYSNEQGGRQCNRESRRESSVVQTNKDRAADHCYNDRDMRYNNDKRTSYSDKGIKYYNDRCVGRFSKTERNCNSMTRSQSSTNFNKTSVQPHAGRSFMIDTSVDSTFQNFIREKGTQIFNNDFNTRRKRASSVGRSNMNEISASRNLLQYSKPKPINDIFPSNSKNNRYTRARSLVRDIKSSSDEKSFQDIKTDFKIYKTQIDSKLLNIDNHDGLNNRKSRSKHSSHSTIDSSTKTDNYEIHKKVKSSESKNQLQYTPRINSRDPRVHVEVDNKTKNKESIRHSEKQSGIVYSNDNIAKGAVLGSGFGVKNYKIPKIKRITSKIDDKESNVDEKLENLDNKKSSDVDIDRSNIKTARTVEKTKIDENSTKRVTRSSSKISSLNSVDKDKCVTTSKAKKPLVYESGSENDKMVNEEHFKENKTLLSQKVAETPQNLKPENNPHNKFEMNTVFSFEEVDVFSDNIVSDPVIENINELIADLDNDIGTSKNDNISGGFTEDDTFQSMLNIVDDSRSLDQAARKTIQDINEINNEGNDIENEVQENLAEEVKSNESFDIKKTQFTNSPLKTDEEVIDKTINNTNDNVCGDTANELKSSEKLVDEPNVELYGINSEPTVSTTFTESDCTKLVEENNIVTRTDEENIDGSSTPDSTITMNEDFHATPEAETMPDSTNEQKSDVKSNTTNDSNTDVTSTNTSGDPTATLVKPCCSTQITSTIDSIGSLLSILQDKSKIKELVSMLGEKTGENEKIMKKLEKLSEIISDDEATNIDSESGVVNETIEDEIKIDIANNAMSSSKNIIHDSEINKDMEVLKIPLNDSEPTLETISDKNIDNNAIDDSVSIVETNSITNESNVDTALNEILSPRKEEKITCLKEDINSHNNLENKKVLVTQDETKLNSNPEVVTNETQVKPFSKTKKYYKKSKRKCTKTRKGIRNTRTAVSNEKTVKNTVKNKPSRELLQLQEDIKEMFLNEEVLNTSGIRMCRLAKIGNEKVFQKEDTSAQDPKPVVLVKKGKGMEKYDSNTTEKLTKKKPGPKSKSKVVDLNVGLENQNNSVPKNKVSAKSNITLKHVSDSDPYAFESDSVDASTVNENRDEAESSSDADCMSLKSSQSFGSNELLANLAKNPKRKRRSNAWQAGIIKPKNKKKIVSVNSPKPNELLSSQTDTAIPDMECFTDKLYCFEKNVHIYSCRLCIYTGHEIVYHYKKKHPHVEIPLSRMNPTIATEAIAQCKNIDFRIIRKVLTDNYVCRFCYKEFDKEKNIMESFFWHIVSMHTGEYKHNCSECENNSDCLSNLDIPPPPKDMKGQLIGYICMKCHFTQISVENLKRHVIIRHNDEKTEVYKINLAAMPTKLSLVIQETSDPNRITRSSLTNCQVDDIVYDQSDYSETYDEDELRTDSPEPQTLDIPKKKSKIIFSTDNDFNEPSLISSQGLLNNVKHENVRDTIQCVGSEDKQSNFDDDNSDLNDRPSPTDNVMTLEISSHVNDILKCAHFKINHLSSGTKEYVCCINGQDNHYKTSLLISIKKHIQSKHTEFWDGYCILCKVIIKPQGSHSFKDCLQHMLDEHMDDFPLLDNSKQAPNDEVALPTKSYINVRPLEELITDSIWTVSDDASDSYPKINNVVSLETVNVEAIQRSPSYPIVKKPVHVEKQYKYEEWQAEVMSKKHRVVLESMMSRDKLVQVYKCAGRFCSFTTDKAEDALLHASTHQRMGGQNALICAYCDFDTSGNAIDLVMHVFKVHGRCQYACAVCFYRAVAGPLVGAHVDRIHKEKQTLGSVLRSKSHFMPITEDSANLLSREDAVPYYYCAHSVNENDTNARCLHKTYLPDKFFEHLEQKHDSPHPCFMCAFKATKPIDLIDHMQQHNMNAYQCTWCEHGAENELNLMMHTSIHHPTKQPNAYVRVITTKDNLSELRILPMASFNKLNTPVEDVTSDVNDDPLREAERSLDLEKLIGEIEIVNTKGLVPCVTPIKEDKNVMVESPIVVEANEQDQSKTDRYSNRTVSDVHDFVQLHKTKNVDIRKEDVVGVIKTEVNEDKTISEPSEVIYCPDSDEGDTRQPIIDLSKDDSVAESIPAPVVETFQKISSDLLHKCPKCKGIIRTFVGFKRHLASCWGQWPKRNYKCAHYPCQEMLSNPNEVVTHYSKDHKDYVRPSFVCGICSNDFSSLQTAKSHFKVIHKIDNHSIRTTVGPNGISVATLYKKVDTPPRKRKSSSETAKQRCYGPDDVGKLPITPILDDFVYCSLCEFSTKVRLNLVRHLQLHAEQQPVPDKAPVNPVPHLETNEKHFDKMLNLASSSFVTRISDKVRSDANTSVSFVSAETASRYPKYVPSRQRYTCGSKGCSYISLSEDMLRFHWETLHSNTNEYNCVHCHPKQQFDGYATLTASLIIEHLKMHDTMLYACSMCPFYHYIRDAVVEHMASLHNGQRIVVVREDSSVAGVSAPVASTPPAPTMDLKPWQCGLCRYKSMLRAEVAEHCSIAHQSKMQYKCTYCPFRTSAMENVTKHQLNSHPDKHQDVFHYYYREGSVPDDENGTPLWMKQNEKMNPTGPEIKTELVDSTMQTAAEQPPALASKAFPVDLNIVKREVVEAEVSNAKELSDSDLCEKYGQFCEPNGILYKCSLCKAVVEEEKQAMQSHLYEELKYRRYSCGICTYKAYHTSGLSEHMTSEHNRESQDPIKLPVNVNLERWVTKHLEYQADLIKVNAEKITKQRLVVSKVTAGPTLQLANKPAGNAGERLSDTELEKTFGTFGTPLDSQFSCPKCPYTFKDEQAMRQHMEEELAKIRWGCSVCSNFYLTYHHAQFHCKSVHTNQSARPVDAVRDPNVRESWIARLIQSQRDLMDGSSSKPPDDQDNRFLDDSNNSLLVVRYEERVPTPEGAERRKRPLATESDDEDIPQEESIAKKSVVLTCKYCKFTTKYPKTLKEHTYRHYNLKPYRCSICHVTGHRATMYNHIQRQHPKTSVIIEATPIPEGPPIDLILDKRKATKQTPTKTVDYLVCLLCEKSITEKESETHVHENRGPEFVKKGEIVVKCCICFALRIDVKSLQEHHDANHQDLPINYSFFKMRCDSRDTYQCVHCKTRFKYIRDLRTHHNAVHSSLQLDYMTSNAAPAVTTQEESRCKRKIEEPTMESSATKRVAKKSTSKLPKFKTVAKKSTTKLPAMVYSDDSDIELHPESSYGQKPQPIESYGDVTALMPFCGTTMRFTMSKLTAIIPIEPKVIVKDVKSDMRKNKK